MSTKHLLVIRHPETEANVAGRWVGRGDTAFTQAGRAQIELIISEIARYAPDVVWSSPLERARIPAAAAAERAGLQHRVDDRLSELDFGLAEGLTFEEAEEQGVTFDFKSEDAPVAAGGESRRDILVRTAAVVDEALGESDRVAIVTHGGVFRSAVVHLLGLPISAIWTFNIRNAAIAEIKVGDWQGSRQWGRIETFRLAGECANDPAPLP